MMYINNVNLTSSELVFYIVTHDSYRIREHSESLSTTVQDIEIYMSKSYIISNENLK